MDLVLLGAITGVANGLLGVGIVLIHRATRVINLAHGEIGAFGVAMVLFFIRVAHLPYALAVPLAIASCGVLGAVLERSILRRLANSPRLIVLIATIGMSQLVTVLRLIVSTIKGSERSLIGGGTEFPVPFHSPVVAFGRVTLRPEHLMLAVIGPALAIGLFAFLRFSAYGIALRASAENATRARLLGIPVGRVSTVAWVLSSVLAGSAAILLAPVVGFSTTAAVGLPLLMRGLAAATVARYEGIGTAFQVGVGLGILDELVFHATGQNGLTDVVLFVVVLGALIFRSGVRRRTSGAEESSWELAEPSRPLTSRSAPIRDGASSATPRRRSRAAPSSAHPWSWAVRRSSSSRRSRSSPSSDCPSAC